MFADNFTMTNPDGVMAATSILLDNLKTSHGQKSDDFKSNVSGFSLLQRFSDTVSVSYEDTQTSQHLNTTWLISALFEIPTVGSDHPKM
eukprot:TRINITY_DN5520_c0_g1_i1.p1 TRINITY_DN5520_c0_g1~~TRINITY_DN5520_c0_g1_i1.p1  ORF type:complete len:96 (-),score=20.68 TRINITY_DN5520_c0_g1_i1:109-375(-)